MSLGTATGLPSASTRLIARSENVSRPRLSITSLAASVSARSSVARLCTKPSDSAPITSGRVPPALADWIWVASWSSAMATTLTSMPVFCWKAAAMSWVALTRSATSSADQKVIGLVAAVAAFVATAAAAGHSEQHAENYQGKQTSGFHVRSSQLAAPGSFVPTNTDHEPGRKRSFGER